MGLVNCLLFTGVCYCEVSQNDRCIFPLVRYSWGRGGWVIYDYKVLKEENITKTNTI